jgi:hypothetical protein
MAGAVNTNQAALMRRPAGLAAARISRAALLLGGLGLGVALLAVVRVLGTWRVGTEPRPHRIAIFGLNLTYPAANAGAIVILVLAILGSAVIAIATAAAVHEIVGSTRLARRLRAERPVSVGGALIIRDDVPRAFCAGLARPRIYVSSAAVGLLDESALSAVLEHERHHAERLDPLRFATARVIARALFFLPPLAELARRHRALAELGADENAVQAAHGDRSPLARAMLAFDAAGGPAGAVGVDPARVDYLLGDPPIWRFPVLLCAAAGSVLALIAAVAVLAGRVAAGTATLAPPFVSRQPCILVLAMVPVAIALVGAYLLASDRSRLE